MADHAWCHDIARDAAVRAAEDGRDRPLPTLEEAIVLAFGFDKASAQRACDEVKSWPEDVQKDCRFVLGNLLEQGVERLQALVKAWRYGKGLLAARYPDMIQKSGSASSAVDHENKGDGMRTERITLEVTHDLDARLSDWIVSVIDESLGMMESVRVVEETKLAPHANDDGGSNHAAQAASGGGWQQGGWLTADEREIIAGIADDDEYTEEGQNIATALLARSSPPEVVKPGPWKIAPEFLALGLNWRQFVDDYNQKRDSEWIAALAAAGVAVKEVGRE